MRQEKEQIIKNTFRTLALKTRDRLKLTQKEMAARLDMCERSYFDIEAGKTKCGTLIVLLLLMELEEPRTLLCKLKLAFNTEYERQMMAV